MNTDARRPLPQDVVDSLNQTGRNAMLAGCTANEAITLCRQTMDTWTQTAAGREWLKHAEL